MLVTFEVRCCRGRDDHTTPLRAVEVFMAAISVSSRELNVAFFAVGVSAWTWPWSGWHAAAAGWFGSFSRRGCCCRAIVDSHMPCQADWPVCSVSTVGAGKDLLVIAWCFGWRWSWRFYVRDVNVISCSWSLLSTNRTWFALRMWLTAFPWGTRRDFLFAFWHIWKR